MQATTVDEYVNSAREQCLLQNYDDALSTYERALNYLSSMTRHPQKVISEKYLEVSTYFFKRCALFEENRKPKKAKREGRLQQLIINQFCF